MALHLVESSPSKIMGQSNRTKTKGDLQKHATKLCPWAWTCLVHRFFVFVFVSVVVVVVVVLPIT